MTEMLRVRVVSSGFSGAPGLNTFYFRPYEDNPSAELDDATECTERVRAALSAAARLWPPTMSFAVSGTVDVLDSATGDVIKTFTAATPAVVAGNDDKLVGPGGVGIQIKFGTGGLVHGHKVKGRAFLVPISNQWGANGLLVAFHQTTADNLAIALIARPALSPVAIVWSRPVKVATPTVPIRAGSAHDITGSNAPSKPVVMRSRRD